MHDKFQKNTMIDKYIDVAIRVLKLVNRAFELSQDEDISKFCSVSCNVGI